MLTRTVSFYNATTVKTVASDDVVMLTRTVSFYNAGLVDLHRKYVSCHAYPNGKLLQLRQRSHGRR